MKTLRQEALLKAKGSQRFAGEFGVAEEGLSEELGCIGEFVRDIAAATHSLSCGTNDRDCNQGKCLQEAGKLTPTSALSD